MLYFGKDYFVRRKENLKMWKIYKKDMEQESRYIKRKFNHCKAVNICSSESNLGKITARRDIMKFKAKTY